MSIYPIYLKTIVALRKAAIALHLTHPPRLIPRGITLPVKGINAKYHGDYDSSGPFPTRAAVQSADQLIKVLNGSAPIMALVETADINLVQDIALAAKFNHPNLMAIELGNEIDLTGLSARGFSNFLESGYTLLRNAGYTGPIISGGVSRVRPDTLKYLDEALIGVAPEVMVGIHRYAIDNDASIPQDGYVNRDDECNAILKVTDGRRIAVTEFGYALLDGYSPAELAKVVYAITVDLEYFRKMGAAYAMYYQWLNGPTNTPIDRFGIEAITPIKKVLLA